MCEKARSFFQQLPCIPEADSSDFHEIHLGANKLQNILPSACFRDLTLPQHKCELELLQIHRLVDRIDADKLTVEQLTSMKAIHEEMQKLPDEDEHATHRLSLLLSAIQSILAYRDAM